MHIGCLSSPTLTLNIAQARRLGEDIGDMSPQLKNSFILTIKITSFCPCPPLMSPTHLKFFVVYKFRLVPPPNIGHATALNLWLKGKRLRHHYDAPEWHHSPAFNIHTKSRALDTIVAWGWREWLQTHLHPSTHHASSAKRVVTRIRRNYFEQMRFESCGRWELRPFQDWQHVTDVTNATSCMTHFERRNPFDEQCVQGRRWKNIADEFDEVVYKQNNDIEMELISLEKYLSQSRSILMLHYVMMCEWLSRLGRHTEVGRRK